MIKVCYTTPRGDIMEMWKDIEGYEGLYQVSNQGRVRIIKERKLSIDKNGYNTVMLVNNGQRKLCKVHRLVAKAFIDNSEFKTQVNHIDGDKSNNKSDNLEWVTPSENTLHSYKMGLAKSSKGRALSVETKMKISKGNKGKKVGIDNPNSIPRLIIYNNEKYIFDSKEEAKRYFLELGFTGVEHWFNKGIPKKHRNLITYVGYLKDYQE